jgi:hypothetical protein
MTEYRIVKKEKIHVNAPIRTEYTIESKFLWFWIPAQEYYLSNHDLDYDSHHCQKPRHIAFVNKCHLTFSSIDECKMHIENLRNPFVEYYHRFKLVKILRKDNSDIYISKYLGKIGIWSVDKKYCFEYSNDITALKASIDKLVKPKQISTIIYS